MITAYLPKLHASRRFDMRISNCSEYMKLRQNHATCRLWKTLEPQICLRCLWKCFQRVQRPQIDLQLTWFGLQNIHFWDTNDFSIFSVFFGALGGRTLKLVSRFQMFEKTRARARVERGTWRLFFFLVSPMSPTKPTFGIVNDEINLFFPFFAMQTVKSGQEGCFFNTLD